MRHRLTLVLAGFASLAAVTVCHAQSPTSSEKPAASQQPAPAIAPPASAANVAAAQALLSSARAHEKNREFDKAIADLDKALALHPRYTAAYLDLANLHHVKRNFDQAIAALNQAILLDGKLAIAYASRMPMRLVPVGVEETNGSGAFR